MNCFQIIKGVLDEAYNDIEGSEAEKDEFILDALEDLREQYSKLLKGIDIDYSYPVTRFAYIYAYVTSHANIVCSVIEKSHDLKLLFDKNKVNVACIGGGPGSDFLGILKYLMLNDKKTTIKFQLCDREKTWAESWSDVDDKVDPEFRISTSYLPLDVTDPKDWKNHTKYLQSDLFTMIYFMSEVRAFRDNVDAYFENLFKSAKSGALFLFVDNNNSNFYDWFDELAKKHGVQIIESKETSMIPPSDENKYDLCEYYDKFTYPKLKANVAYRIGRKL
ncbi:MAG: hypothetical protein ACM37W_19905 [Actinomycetota bacterium]